MNQIIVSIRKIVRNGRFPALVALVGMGILLAAAGARAGGAIPTAPSKAATAPTSPFVSPHADDEGNEHAGIPGLWHVIYTATFADGLPSPPFPSTTPFQFLESYKTWHADGTEFENAFLPPATGNVCFGVWKDMGDHRVKLHHIGLMFAPDGAISNVFTVDETDTVASDGKTYSGNFEFKLFLPTDVFGTGTPLAVAKGTDAGTRITVD
jgi:hypothetical protein